jgi:Sec-independent protein translocase protein TatA
MPGMGVSGILVLSLTVALVFGSRRFPRTARPARGATGGFLSGPAQDDPRTPEPVGLTLRHIQLRELQRTPEPWDHLPLEVAHLPEDGDSAGVEVEVEDAAEVEVDGAAITLVIEEDVAVEEDDAVTDPEYGPVRVDLEGASGVAA